jgi:hypothetical protein
MSFLVSHVRDISLIYPPMSTVTCPYSPSYRLRAVREAVGNEGNEQLKAKILKEALGSVSDTGDCVHLGRSEL